MTQCRLEESRAGKSGQRVWVFHCAQQPSSLLWFAVHATAEAVFRAADGAPEPRCRDGAGDGLMNVKPACQPRPGHGSGAHPGHLERARQCQRRARVRRCLRCRAARTGQHDMGADVVGRGLARGLAKLRDLSPIERVHAAGSGGRTTLPHCRSAACGPYVADRCCPNPRSTGTAHP